MGMMKEKEIDSISVIDNKVAELENMVEEFIQNPIPVIEFKVDCLLTELQALIKAHSKALNS